MRYFLFFLLIPASCFGVSQLYQEYKGENNISQEFENFAENAQDKSFTVFTTTPNYTELRDGEIVVYASTPAPVAQDIKLMLRVGTTIYASPVFPIMKGR